MGLDASVRCRCFEEGKLRPGPVPVEDLYIDEDGDIWSRKLHDAHKRYDYRRYEARYGGLEAEFTEWLERPCEHEDGVFCCEWVSNWAGCAQFCELVEEVGGEESFPLLSGLLPEANGGIYPAEKARTTLDELDRFIEKVTEAEQWVLCDCETGEEIWRSTDSGSFTWRYGINEKAGMIGGKAFFFHERHPYLETTHFRQEPIGRPNTKGEQRMRIICLDTQAESETFDSLGPEGVAGAEREFRVILKKAPFLYEGKYWTAERIRNLLVASVETGNPIRWC